MAGAVLGTTAVAQTADCPANKGLAELRAGTSEGRLSGETVRVRGRVSARFPGESGLDGFFIQQPEPGASPTGLFVYTPEHTAAQLPPKGSRVSILGQAGSHRGRPQLEWVEAIQVCGRATPQAVTIAPPLSSARRKALADVLVTTRDPLVITGNHQLKRWGVLQLAVSERRFHPETGVRGGRDADLLLDDGSYNKRPEPTPYLGDKHGRRVGSRLGPTRGVLVNQFGDWRLHPVNGPEFIEANPRSPPPPRPSGTLRLVSLNLRNFFPITAERGPGDRERRHLQESAVIEALAQLQADVVVVQELANNRQAAAELRRRLNRAAGLNYRFANGPGPIGSDAIRVGLLLRTDRLDLRAASVLRDGPHERPPVRARLSASDGRVVEVVGVHFKSRGGCKRNSACGSERRLKQARSLASWMQPATEVPSFVLGDFNSYASEAPMRLLERAGLEPSVAPRVEPRQRYTYVYRGRSGMLDFALADSSARALPLQGSIWHLGSDEALGAGPGGPWGASDHDAVILDWAPISQGP